MSEANRKSMGYSLKFEFIEIIAILRDLLKLLRSRDSLILYDRSIRMILPAGYLINLYVRSIVHDIMHMHTY